MGYLRESTSLTVVSRGRIVVSTPAAGAELSDWAFRPIKKAWKISTAVSVVT
jgi:hypothetical protein